MISSDSFAISKYEFNSELPRHIDSLHYAKDLWPIVYILSDGEVRVAYVGETTDVLARMSAHLKNNYKSKLTAVHLIESDKFNKSATLDIESYLIKYISGDGKYKLLNGNLGLANHNYYQKHNVYWGIFTSIWDNLRALGITSHSIEHIDNSDLFKYSPYKSLSSEQLKGLLMIIDNLLDGSYKNIVIQGGAGTGKTILAVFLFKLLATDLADFRFKDMGGDDDQDALIEKITLLRAKFPDQKMALVVPMASFRSTLKKVFSNVKGLKSSMVVGPAEIANEKFDLVVVDESHRLRRRVNLGAYYGAFDKACEKLNLDKSESTELVWIRNQSKCAVYFYDENQSIKPSDVKSSDFALMIASKDSIVGKLSSQFRVKGGNGYVKFVHDLLSGKPTPYLDKKYEFKHFDSLADLVEEIKSKNTQYGLCRLIAGYSWEWISKTDPNLYDINIERVQLRWNATNTDWINSDNAIAEVGCIHTTQGYDLNYAGVIFGHEIGYDVSKNEIVIYEQNYFDRNGKQTIKSPLELKAYILNIYKTILLRGIKGTFIYVCDQDLRQYFKKNILYEEVKILANNPEPLVKFQNSVPLIDLKVAAGTFSNLQLVEENDNLILIPKDIRPSPDLFACKVVGESMNKVIPNGSICLFKQYSGGSRNGMIVLVQSSELHNTEMGSGYTVKEYYSKKVVNETGWEHQTITLKPLSHDPTFENIQLTGESLESFNVIATFERVLGPDFTNFA